MRELRIPAERKRLDEVLDFVDEVMNGYSLEETQKIILQICIEEVFVNIANYAYPDGAGEATIYADVKEWDSAPTLVMTFVDQGIPFDPLKKEDPDVTLSAEKRQIGGLGIYMVKDKMDDVAYEYADGCNRLTIRKKLALIR